MADLILLSCCLDTKADITINNHLDLINTKMLREYASMDPRMRHLVLLVKYWAKRRKVNYAYVGTLSIRSSTIIQKTLAAN
jgi:DNA polymerase sigma